MSDDVEVVDLALSAEEEPGANDSACNDAIVASSAVINCNSDEKCSSDDDSDDDDMRLVHVDDSDDDWSADSDDEDNDNRADQAASELCSRSRRNPVRASTHNAQYVGENVDNFFSNDSAGYTNFHRTRKGGDKRPNRAKVKVSIACVSKNIL